MTLLLALAAAACGDGRGPATTPSGPGAPERVTYQAEDAQALADNVAKPVDVCVYERTAATASSYWKTRR